MNPKEKKVRSVKTWLTENQNSEWNWISAVESFLENKKILLGPRVFKQQFWRTSDNINIGFSNKKFGKNKRHQYLK